MKHRFGSKQSGTLPSALVGKARGACCDSRRKALSRPVVVGAASAAAKVRVSSASSPGSTHQPSGATVSADPRQSPGLFKTKSGLDITQTMMELMWQASEDKQFTFEMAKEAFSGQDLSPEDIAAVWRTLGLAGVDLVNESAVKPVPSAAPIAAGGVVHLTPLNGAAHGAVQQPDQAQPLAGDEDAALLKRMEHAEDEMRHILFGFGFAAHEHTARAEKLLVHPSAQHFETLVTDSSTRSRDQYLQMLPGLVEQTRALDQKAAALYRNCRQGNGEEHQTELSRLNRDLQHTFLRFGYQPKVIREMITIAHGIAGKFRASQRVLLQAGRDGDSVSQMALVDVERQTIETIEEFVRMPCEVFLRSCTQLNTAATRFQQARRELIQGHLHLVASIAQTCSNRGLLLPELLREGIFGLTRAVEQYAYRYDRKFSTYAACWIRRSLRDALAGTPSAERKASLPSTPEGHSNSVHPLNGQQADGHRQTDKAPAARKAIT